MALYYFSNTPHATRSDGTKVDTKAHYNYICRKEQYASRERGGEELVYSRSGNMPDWAKTPGEFWQEAEAHRQKGGRAYREIRLGLQEELSLEDNIALVEEFLEESGIGKDHAYTYAIHDKVAAFDEDHRNIHVHIMFNEKIQEPERPLDRETFFKHYYENKEGEPCAGYKASRKYQSKGGTKDMRVLWADLVNQKFKDRGIDKKVSEKSLSDQADELRAEGKLEEARLLDRLPSPHLGNRFKTPEMLQKIGDRVREIYHQLEHPEETKEEAAQTDFQETLDEQLITLFAADKLLRQLERDIRRERQTLRREEVQAEEARRLADADDRAAEELAARPIVITVDDVVAALVQKTETAQAEAACAKEESAALYGRLIPPERVYTEAVRQVLGPEYYNAKKRYDRAAKKLKPLEEEYRKRLDEPYEAKKEFLAVYLKARDEEAAARKEWKRLEARRKGPDKEAIQEAMAAIKETGARDAAQAKQKYGQYQKLKRNADWLAQKVQDVQQKAPSGDTILYEKGLPNLVFRSARLEGKTPLEELPLTAVDGKAYVLLPGQDNPDTLNGKTALLLGDAVYHGKARVYRFEETKNAEGEVTYQAVLTQDKVPLYTGAQGERTRPERLPQGTKTWDAFTARRTAVDKAVDSVTRHVMDALANDRGRYNASWEDSDKQYETQDEVQRLDADIHRGMGM